MKRGNAQGDIISPFLFLLGYQILLFKINHDLQIKSPLNTITIPEGCPPIVEEVRILPTKVLAMADDANVIVEMEHGSLSLIKNILDNFGILSGLECNIEKTLLMPIGALGHIPDNIRELGFDIRESATVLGMEISNNMGAYEKAAEKIKMCLKKEINFWLRFRLSLPGRIAVSKSMLYSQLNYTGSFLPFSPAQIGEMSLIIETFVKGNLNIAKKRIFTTVKMGGLGLCNVQDFLNAQKCSWFRLALGMDEDWKTQLYVGTLGNITGGKKKWFENQPILYGLCNALEEFTSKYNNVNENFKKANIFDNPTFFYGHRPVKKLDEEFFNMEERNRQIENLTVDKIYIDGRFSGIRQIFDRTGVALTAIQWGVLTQSINNTANRVVRVENNGKGSVSMAELFGNLKKGSKIFKKTLTNTKDDYIPHNIVKFQENTNSIIGSASAKTLNGMWGANYMDNATRTFCFKLHNNTLGYNYVVNKFVRNHSPCCTFCILTHNPDDERDTPLHIFYSCRSVEPVYAHVFTTLLGHDELESFGRSKFFGTYGSEDTVLNSLVATICLMFKKYIWDCKQREILPTGINALWYIQNRIELICEINKKFKKNWEKSLIYRRAPF